MHLTAIHSTQKNNGLYVQPVKIVKNVLLDLVCL